MFNKKIILAIILISVFVVGLQMEPVNAMAGKKIDSGSFKVSGKTIKYIAELDNKEKNLYIEAYGGKFSSSYIVKKVKNENKVYKYNDIKFKYQLKKTYNTKKSLKNFYFSPYKKTVLNELKSDAKQVLKK
jgi:hypothetical protein